MIDIIMDLCGDEMDSEGTETWTNELDRGGLWHINDQAHAVFIIIEGEIRRHLKVAAFETTREKILEDILQNEDLLFQWT
jgi:hypothetical protein